MLPALQPDPCHSLLCPDIISLDIPLMGHKKAAILDMKELERVQELLEDLADLKAIEDRVCEKEESYKACSRKKKSSIQVMFPH